MFQAFKDFVSELTGGHKDPSRFEEGDYRLAAAALLVHVGMIDGTLSDVERAKLLTIVKRCFQLDYAAAGSSDRGRQRGGAERSISIISPASQSLARRKKVASRMVEMMWQMVYAIIRSPSSRTISSGARPISLACPRVIGSSCGGEWRAVRRLTEGLAGQGGQPTGEET